MTWEILRHYANLSSEVIKALEDTIDSPSNGILLQREMHDAFDAYEWYFEKTACYLFISSLFTSLTYTFQDQANVYRVQWLATEPLVIFDLKGREIVEFTNQSNKPIPLPEMKFLMIHAAIAKVLAWRGVGKCLDLIIDKFHPGSSPLVPGKLCQDLGLFLSVLSLAEAQLAFRINAH